MSEKCRGCGHYETYLMLKSGKPHGYAGDIACLRCEEYTKPNSEYIPKGTQKEVFQ